MQLSLAACLVTGLFCAGQAGAVGSRNLYPQGYLTGEPGYDAVLNANAGRALMNFSGNVYGGVVRARTFIYVYAQAGERILLGRDSNGTASVYAPGTDFGPRGNEAPAGGSSTDCSISAGNGRINSRAAELAGPGTAAGVTTGSQYVPCVYQVTQTGIHGVLMEASNTQLDRWEIAVRADNTSAVDLPGRVFTYAFAAQTGSNNTDPSTGSTPYRLYSTFHYVTQDGYRYRQQMKGLDPNAFAIYANARGFLDAGEPLYKNAVGTSDYLNTGIEGGVTLEAPAYPIFFEDISGTQADATLTELGIPLVPPEPVIDNVVFSYPPGGTSHSYVGRGGVISFDATDVMSYQIVISAGGDYDVANPLNRVLEGSAVPGRNEVLWDGLANNGSPVPANAGGTPYNFQVVGRNGEAHFPLLDAEKNFNGGPVITQLNGLGVNGTTIYYDDRAYKTRAGVEVGTIAADGTPEHLCGGTLDSRHVTTPVEGLNGLDSSSTAGYGTTSNGAPRYPRYWGGNAGNTGGCGSSSEFADKLGLDLWVLQKSDPEQPAMGILIYASADVTARVSAPTSVAPGAPVIAQIEFGNVGSSTAAGVNYGANLPGGLSGVSCSGATCSYNPVTGAVTISGLPPTLTSGQWVPPVTLSYNAPAAGSALIQATIATSSSQEPNPGHAPDSAGALTAVGVGGSVADVMASVSAPVQAVAGQSVNVPVSFRNFGPLDAADISYVVQLPPGTTGVNCGAPATCGAPDASGQLLVTFPSGNTLAAGHQQSFVLTYTAPSVGSTVPVSARVATSTDEGGSTANNNASGMTTVIDPGTALADVTVSISPPASATAGQPVSVPVVFENKGPNEASGASYTVSIPSGLTNVTCAPAVCSVSGGSITWTGPATLGNGQRFNASFSYTAPSTGPVNHTATIGTSSSESNTGNNLASASTSIIAPDMRVDLGGLTPPAAQVPYNGSFTCTNIGSSAATDNTSCSVSGLPSGLSQGACALTPGGGAWSTGDAVPVGGVVTCAVTGTPAAPTSSTTVTGNTDTDDDADPSNNQATVSLAVQATTAAPTLSGWALILLSGLLAFIGLNRPRARPAV